MNFERIGIAQDIIKRLKKKLSTNYDFKPIKVVSHQGLLPEVVYGKAKKKTFVVINKPPGWHVTTVQEGEPSLEKFLHENSIQLRKVYPVNRLDKSTRGLVVLAMNPRAAFKLNNSLLSDQWIKEYRCVVKLRKDSYSWPWAMERVSPFMNGSLISLNGSLVEHGYLWSYLEQKPYSMASERFERLLEHSDENHVNSSEYSKFFTESLKSLENNDLEYLPTDDSWVREKTNSERKIADIRSISYPESVSPVDYPQSKLAITEFWLEKVQDQLARYRVRTLTGRSHQIRAHFAEAGAPIVGDPHFLCKTQRMVDTTNYLALQGHKLSFPNPLYDDDNNLPSTVQLELEMPDEPIWNLEEQ